MRYTELDILLDAERAEKVALQKRMSLLTETGR